MLSDRGLYEAGEAAATERKKPKLPRLARALHEAGVETPAANWAAGVAAIAFVSLSLAAALTGDPGIGAVVGAAALATAGVRLHVRRLRRRELLDRQLARALPQIAASVRTRSRSSAAHGRVARRGHPLREELARVLADTAYGTTLAMAFERMARRTDSPDVRSLAAAVRIQQRFGGAVAPVLDLIAAHAAARLRTSRELKTELAGTRLAKWFVALAMPAIFFIMFATNADFSQFYREQPLGWIVLGVAGCSEAFGLFACQRITAMDRSRR
ncbi:MAG: type II secretion system F family protein [Eggerthella lenta]